MCTCVSWCVCVCMCVYVCVSVCARVCLYGVGWGDEQIQLCIYGCQILGCGNLFVVDLATKLQSMVTKGLTIRVDIIYQPHTKP